MLFIACPVGYGFYLSLYSWDPLGGSRFVGFRNYQCLVSDPRFLNAILVTVKFVLITVPLVIILGLLMALVLWQFRKRNTKIAAICQSLWFMPYVLSVSVVAIVWRWLLDANVGLVQYYLRGIGLPVLLGDFRWALPTIALVTVWWISGYRMLIFQAALEDIPNEVIEAAVIDGANFFQQIYKIILPLLKPAMTFAVVFTLIMAFQMFGQVLLMTEGGPGRSTELLGLYVYRVAFDYLDIGRAAAAGFILAVLILAAAAVILRKGLKSSLQ